ncbi:hypothetical protein [Streptomyces sp. GESEQ-13]|uniref:hypothetical protein n=1 Tax=Streptomyces sp. GESEQ-13 TaxID=2812654 RepID=UPI001B3196B8
MAELSELRFFEDVLDWIVFDSERRAIFLVAGNKAARRQWADWYPRAVKEADDRYTAYLEALEQEKRKGRDG